MLMPSIPSSQNFASLLRMSIIFVQLLCVIGVRPNKIESMRGVSSTWSLVMEQFPIAIGIHLATSIQSFWGFLEYPVPSIFLGCGFLSNGRAPYRFPALILPKDGIWGRIRKNVLRGPHSPWPKGLRMWGSVSLSPLSIRPSCSVSLHGRAKLATGWSLWPFCFS